MHPRSFLFVVLLPLLTGCAEMSSFVQVSSPALQNFGVRKAEYVFQITNTTGYLGDVIAFGKKVDQIYPGETLVARNLYQPLSQCGVALAVVFHDEDQNYAGVAYRVVEAGAYAQSMAWIIREADVTRLGVRLLKPPSAKSIYEPRERRFVLPNGIFNGETWKQIVNDSPSKLRVLVNGGLRATLKTGEVYALRIRALYPGYNQPTLITIFGLNDSEEQTGTAEYQLYPQSSGISASQEIVSPYSLRYN